MTKQYAVFVLDKPVAWIWADSIETGEQYSGSRGDPNDLWFRIGDETVGSVKTEAGVDVRHLDSSSEWQMITPDSIRAATQKQSSETAQPAAE